MSQLTLNILTFPVWWYVSGTKIMWDWAGRQYHFGLHKTGLLLFARHMREPLYGDYTRSGMVLSFFLRIFLLIFKLLAFAVRMLLVGLAILLHFILLPAVIVMIIYQFFPA